MGEAMTESQQNLEGGGGKGRGGRESPCCVQPGVDPGTTQLHGHFPAALLTSLPVPLPLPPSHHIHALPFPSLPFPRLLVSPGLAAMTSCTVKLP